MQKLSFLFSCTVASLPLWLFPAQELRAQTPTAESVVVSATPSPTPYDFHKEKALHIMPEVSGTQITVTKKATVIKLDKQPPIENNNLQEEFTKAPGFLVTEQHTPGQFNFSYRGLGNPQESEFVSVMQDGIPLEGDWIGFPTLYYLPLPQGISEIQLIRGGGSLLYGPEPAPVVNFVTKHPLPDTPWNVYTEELGGPYGFYSTYSAVQEADGPLEARMDAGYDHSDGQRSNSQYDQWQADGYLGYRPNDNQLYAVDVHAGQFSGGDPGRLPNTELFRQDPDQTLTPYNHDWVDRYTVELRTEQKFGDGWLLIGKAWYTHEEIDARAAANLGGNVPTGADPKSTVFSYEEFNNGGADLRVRKDWGDDTFFHGSTLTFGGVVYHGDAPFQRYTLQNVATTSGGNVTGANFGPNFLYAPRGSSADTIFNGVDIGPTLDQSRHSDYQSIFGEDLIRMGQFHVVLSFRLDHEDVEVESAHAPWLAVPQGPLKTATGLDDISVDHWVPLWGFGMGNDFGNHNETYFSASTGWRPTRYFDIASTSRTIALGGTPSDPFHSLDFELGVHGTPFKGFWYDVGGFWMIFSNRTESLNVDANGNPSNTDFIIENTGTTRNRGLEGELSYDFLALYQHPPVEAPPADEKDKDKQPQQPQVPGLMLERYHPLQLIAWSNIQLLDAVYTESQLHEVGTTGPTLVGNPPAFAPDILWKGGISFRKEHAFDITLTGVYVSSQYWQDSNQPLFFTGTTKIAIPAKIPPYFVMDLSGYYYITKNVRLIAGVSNLADRQYYDRIFSNGIEPAPSIGGYAGFSVEF